MIGRERLLEALNHEETARPPVDFGSTAVTGMHVEAVSRLRLALLGDRSWRVKVVEPYQMLGEIDPALRQALGIDEAGRGSMRLVDWPEEIKRIDDEITTGESRGAQFRQDIQALVEKIDSLKQKKESFKAVMTDFAREKQGIAQRIQDARANMSIIV